MQIVELDTIPRDRVTLTDLVSTSRRRAARSRAIQVAAGVLCVLALCILLYGMVQAQPNAAVMESLYLPVVLR